MDAVRTVEATNKPLDIPAMAPTIKGKTDDKIL